MSDPSISSRQNISHSASSLGGPVGLNPLDLPPLKKITAAQPSQAKPHSNALNVSFSGQVKVDARSTRLPDGSWRQVNKYEGSGSVVFKTPNGMAITLTGGGSYAYNHKTDKAVIEAFAGATVMVKTPSGQLTAGGKVMLNLETNQLQFEGNGSAKINDVAIKGTFVYDPNKGIIKTASGEASVALKKDLRGVVAFNFENGSVEWATGVNLKMGRDVGVTAAATFNPSTERLGAKLDATVRLGPQDNLTVSADTDRNGIDGAAPDLRLTYVHSL